MIRRKSLSAAKAGITGSLCKSLIGQTITCRLPQVRHLRTSGELNSYLAQRQTIGSEMPLIFW